jgi:hypothetical protein
MKLPGIRLVPVELEVGGKPAAEGAKPLQQFGAPGSARDGELPDACDMDFDLIAFLELERLDDDRRKANGEAVAPSGDFHVGLL